MTFWTEGWAYKQTPRSSGAKFVLVCVAHHADERGYCYPSQKRLARMTMLSERAVRGHLHALEEDGLITRKERRSEGGFRSSDGIWLSMTDEELGLAEDSAGSGKPAGNNRQANRQQSTTSPAESAGLYRDETSVNGKGKGNVAYLDQTTRQCIALLQKVKGWKKSPVETASLLDELRAKFPNAEPAKVCDEFEFNTRNGAKPKNAVLTLRTYFRKADEWSQERGASRRPDESMVSTAGYRRFE